METDNRFTLDARLRDLVVCLSGTDMSDDAIISVCLGIFEKTESCSRLMSYLQKGDRTAREIVSFMDDLS